MARRKKTLSDAEWKAAFLQTLEETASVTKACEVSGLPRRTAYNWRGADEQFAKDWDAAVERGTDALEDEAVRRAREGTLRPVFYEGKVCGHVREFSDTLLIFMLKARRPEKYRERSEVKHTGGMTVNMRQQLANLPQDDLDAIERILAKATANPGGDQAGAGETPSS